MTRRAQSRSRRCGWCAAALMVGVLGGAGAGELPSGCSAAAGEPVVVAAVVDARTLRLADGRELLLAGIEPPLAGADRAGAGAEQGARDALAALAAGRRLLVNAAGAPADRHGRLIGQVFLADEPDRWLQAELVRAGHARVSARAGDLVCARALLKAEAAARTAKLGLWVDPYYQVRRAETPDEVLRERGRFAVVEGKVLSVGESGGTIYLNFGRRWSEDFTVTIAKRNQRIFAAAGIEPKALSGKRVRIRGWIEDWGGPWIEATRPEQIESIGRD